MGFRNVPKYASAVDTGSAAPGVKIYATNGNPGSGVVEWDAYNSRVLGQLVSSLTGSGGSYFSLGVPSGNPGIGINTEGLPAGGYGTVIRLAADRVIPSAVYIAQAYQAAAQSLPSGVWSPVSMDTTDLNLGGFLIGSGAPSRIVVPWDGWYEVSGLCHFAGGAGSRRGVRWNWQSYTTGLGTISPLSVAAFIPNVSGVVASIPARPLVVKLAASGWVELQATQDSGANLATFTTGAGGDSAPNVTVKLLAPL